MTQVLPSRIGRDGELEVFGADAERVVWRGWRVGADGKRGRVLAVVPAADQPAPVILGRLAHEYELRAELDRDWAAVPLELVHEAGRSMLVLEDPGGES